MYLQEKPSIYVFWFHPWLQGFYWSLKVHLSQVSGAITAYYFEAY